jgi:8-oxo-dGTP pyrophosphatase MutT (NUDIX family)
MMDDPRIHRIRNLLHGRPAAMTSRAHGPKEAAVALLLRPAQSVELLLIRRAELAGDPWSGHVALPGGRRSAGDPDLLGTACRETEEEVGVAVPQVGTFIGALDELAPVTPLLPPLTIAPFVLAVPPGTHAVPNPREVQCAVWVPLESLRAATALSEVEIDLPPGRRNFPCFVYEDLTIWGLTFRILQQFLDLTEQVD